MIWIEAFLYAVMFTLLFDATVSDLQTGKIRNRSILIAIILGMVGIGPYYGIYASDCFFSYSLNIIFSIIICVLLYAGGIWGAGDCKLLIAVVLLFPARLYCLNNRSVASCFILISLIFSSAFAYVVFESLYLGIRNRDLFSIKKIRIDIRRYVQGFIFYYLYLSICNAVLALVLSERLLSDAILLTLMQFVLLLVAMRIDKYATKHVLMAMGLLWVILVLLGMIHLGFSGVNWRSVFIVLTLMVFRACSEKYNYQMIEVSQLKPGMILSVQSIFSFCGSKTVGLPTFTTEDLKSRLTEEEVSSIKRWAKAKAGRDKIVIVKKIPFALFIAIGTILFSLLEGISL